MTTNNYRIGLLTLLGLTATVSAMAADPPSRVSTACLPLPLPGPAPVPPDRLRAQNPWNLSMTGGWRFRLTHGQIVDGRFTRSLAEAEGLRASSTQTENPLEHAFDGDPQTRWCASNGTFPQWLQADLGQARRVTGITVAWERAAETYHCRIEGSQDGRTWTTLADASQGAGVGSGPVAVTPRTVRLVRMTILSNSATSWASLWELGIHYTDADGKDVTWTPPKPDLTAPTGADDFTQPSYDDAKWDTLAVPSNWEMAGYSLPTYNSVDDAVGLYRRWMDVPVAWRGRRIVWHFDGAMNGAEIFVNGQKAGYHESGYTGFDVDMTGLVKPGSRNLFAARLCKTTPSSEAETGDYQTMGGIYRDTSLIAVPQTHVADITVQTPLTNDYHDAILQATVKVAGTPGASATLAGTLTDAAGKPTGISVSGQAQIGTDGTADVALLSPVKAPRMWSAEKPNLYYLVLTLTQGGQVTERVEQRFGFRQVEVRNNVVLWNGRPIKCTGICRHDFWADKGFALTDKEWNTDLTMMKAANINAVRTSHYNHAQRFLELCDEQGMYILDEVPYCWVGDLVKDPKFAAPLLLRAADTVGRDKNRPCVLAWSLGNENPMGPDSQQVLDLVKRLDPTRPAFVSGQSPENAKGQDWKDDHYPSPETINRFAADTRWGANITEHPHTMYSKPSQDFDPGASDLWSEAMIKTWDKLWQSPNILGSFIWEWQNQGIADKYPDHTTDFYYGPDHMRQENNKGIVSAYRVPKPELWIVKTVYSPIAFSARTVEPQGGFGMVTVTNRYAFTDLNELTCRWTALDGTKVLQSGTVRVDCAPSQSAPIRLPTPSGMTALRVAFVRPDGTEVIASRLAAPGAPTPAPPAPLPNGGPLRIEDNAGTLRVGNGLQTLAFDKRTGLLTQWKVQGNALVTGGPLLNLGEAKEGRWDGYFRTGPPPTLAGASVSATAQPNGVVRAEVKSDVLDKVGGSVMGHLTTVYDIRPDAQIGVHWTLAWTAPRMHLWELGPRLPVSSDLSRMHWWHDAFFTDYPAGHLGEPVGEAQAGLPLFHASKSGLHWLTLTHASGAGLALLQTDGPLVGRGESGPDGDALLADSAIASAGSDDLSRSWFSDREIVASPEAPLSGSFLLRAVGGSR